MRKSRTSSTPSVNAGSMADIAFLLLIFFLVATTIARDKGIDIVLPPAYDGEPGRVADRNVLSLLVNGDDQIMIEGAAATTADLESHLVAFITNPDQSPSLPSSPQKAIISIRHDVETSYEAYLDIYSIIKQAYNQLREDEAISRYGLAFDLCTVAQRNAIRQRYPLRISEAEPYIAHQ